MNTAYTSAFRPFDREIGYYSNTGEVKEWFYGYISRNDNQLPVTSFISKKKKGHPVYIHLGAIGRAFSWVAIDISRVREE